MDQPVKEQPKQEETPILHIHKMSQSVLKFFKHYLKTIIGLVAAFFVLIIVVTALTSWSQKPLSGNNLYLPTPTIGMKKPVVYPTPTPVFPTDKISMQPISVEGKVQKLSDLHLAAKRDSNYVPEGSYDDYYSAGTITSGPYTGYTRVIASLGGQGMNGYVPIYVLATKDFKTYVLDVSNAYPTFKKYPSELLQYGSSLDLKKILKLDSIGPPVAASLPVGGEFVLSYERISPRITSEVNAPGEYGDGGKPSPLQQFATVNGMRAYEPLVQATTDDGVHDYSKKQGDYVQSKTQVFLEDSTGLLYAYNLSTQKNIDTYFKQLAEYNKAQAEFDNGSNTKYPSSPVFYDNLGFKADTASFTAADHFASYSTGLPHACGGDVNSPILKNISDGDLEPVGKVYGVTMYRIINKDHPLFALQYDTKEVVLTNFGESKAKLSLSEYINKNPLIVIKDPWNRYVLLGEWEISTPGGCGKPVIYLYPTKPTKVSISFLQPMQFDRAIPRYQNNWEVLAQPDGKLTDLQPQFTDCSSLPSGFGSEYAKHACMNNNYPYIYWAGSTTGNGYLKPVGGWIVKRAELSQFMEKKLDEVSFTPKEKEDMLSYWVPEMLRKSGEYYRISFLQTAQLNSMIPMKISPQPDHLFRIFLDWDVYAQNPHITLEPQKLGKVERNGFTVVEWGGLKK